MCIVKVILPERYTDLVLCTAKFIFCLTDLKSIIDMAQNEEVLYP